MSIPKTIHCCWFGGNPKPKKIQMCMESWKRYCPDYEIREWNETNFDFGVNEYAREAYEAKKWAFVSDYARLKVLYDYGGIYLDTDVEVLKSLDQLLLARAFAGFESKQLIGSGILAAEAEHPWSKEMLEIYRERRLVRADGSMDMTPNTIHITKMMAEKFGLAEGGARQSLLDGVQVYPVDWFSPKSWYDGVIRCTENTYTIHHYTGSWGDLAGERFKTRVDKMKPILGEKVAFNIAYVVTGFEKHGFWRGCRIAIGRVLGRGG